MSDSRILSVKPIIHYPRVAQVGKTYLMTIDLEVEAGAEWQYEEEEYPIYCTVDSELFSSKPVGEPVIILHRFGGAYTSADFLLQVSASYQKVYLNTAHESSKITVKLTNCWGIPCYSADLEIFVKSDFMSQDFQSIRDDYPIGVLRGLNNHNLPLPLHRQFVGRQQELSSLIHRLSDKYYERLITVSGIGGVGKTALVVEAAYICLAAMQGIDDSSVPVFNTIIFSSGQLNTLSPHGIIPFSSDSNSVSLKPIRTLEDLCIDIARTLKEQYLMTVNPERQVSALKEFLDEHDKKILIILDNLESLENRHVHKIIDFLRSISSNNVKTIVTTRQNSLIYADIHLKELSKDESFQLIDNLAQEKNITIDASFRDQLSQMCGGIPLAISYSIGRLAINISSDRVLHELDEPEGDLSRYCFDKLVHDLQNENAIAFKLLITLSVTPYGATFDALLHFSEISGAERTEVADALDLLIQSSLVFSNGNHYEMLPLTRKYSLAKLEKDTTFERGVRERWLFWYKALAQNNGGEDWGEWHEQYDKLDEEWKNFKEVLRWCQNQNLYEEVREIWRSLDRFAYLYGYWFDRLFWLEWLIEVAVQKGDLAFLAEAKLSYGWITLLMEGEENLLKAERILQEAWELRKSCTPYICNVIAVNLAVLYTRRGEFKDADEWFSVYFHSRRKQSNQINNEDFAKAQRLEIRYLLYWGESYYRRGNCDRARKLYLQVVKKSDAMRWLRMKIKAYERLAYLAIAEKDLRHAEELLRTWYPVAVRNREYRRTAFYERDYAYLEFSKGDYSKAKEWAIKALKKFQDLKMLVRVERMSQFIRQCDHHAQDQ
jgi:tetratricopeptide (TPR) repeat protein